MLFAKFSYLQLSFCQAKFRALRLCLTNTLTHNVALLHIQFTHQYNKMKDLTPQ